MRHGNKVNALGRKYGHRKAMMRNLASSLILNKRIITTVAKAKELRKYAEPLITKAKTPTTASRRVAFSYLQQKEAVHELFTEIAGKVAERNGGYTRIIKLGTRLGDNAEMAMIELVDYNELYSQAKDSSAKKKSRRRRGGGKSKSDSVETTATADVVETEVAEPTVEEATETATEEAVAEAANEEGDAEEATGNDDEQAEDEKEKE